LSVDSTHLNSYLVFNYESGRSAKLNAVQNSSHLTRMTKNLRPSILAEANTIQTIFAVQAFYSCIYHVITCWAKDLCETFIPCIKVDVGLGWLFLYGEVL